VNYPINAGSFSLVRIRFFLFIAMINILKILVLFIDNRMEKLIKYKISKTYKNSRDWEWISK